MAAGAWGKNARVKGLGAISLGTSPYETIIIAAIYNCFRIECLYMDVHMT